MYENNYYLVPIRSKNFHNFYSLTMEEHSKNVRDLQKAEQKSDISRNIKLLGNNVRFENFYQNSDEEGCHHTNIGIRNQSFTTTYLRYILRPTNRKLRRLKIFHFKSTQNASLKMENLALGNSCVRELLRCYAMLKGQ